MLFQAKTFFIDNPFSFNNILQRNGRGNFFRLFLFAKNADIESAINYFKFLETAKIDGAIISDTGLIALAKEVAPNLPINLSTQANTLNYKTVEFWKKQGIRRVILARELSVKEISEISEKDNYHTISLIRGI